MKHFRNKKPYTRYYRLPDQLVDTWPNLLAQVDCRIVDWNSDLSSRESKDSDSINLQVRRDDLEIAVTSAWCPVNQCHCIWMMNRPDVRDTSLAKEVEGVLRAAGCEEIVEARAGEDA
jgi:hypothetical protein